MLVAIQTLELRDCAWGTIIRDDARTHCGLWQDLTRRAPESVRTPAAALLARLPREWALSRSLLKHGNSQRSSWTVITDRCNDKKSAGLIVSRIHIGSGRQAVLAAQMTDIRIGGGVRRISVGLVADLASAILGAEVGEASPVQRQLRQLEETGVSLAPQQSNLAGGRDLAADEIVWFSTEVADDQAAAELANRLLDLDGVLSAYVVPPEGPP